ncbi:MAG: FAD:protein FMN transferase [Planctomycetaceae bacterium]|jgi:thiamine biosynthesis lipoprotein|nr:FAD:protein FMN transferase [Planctomycetaceae bacterium]
MSQKPSAEQNDQLQPHNSVWDIIRYLIVVVLLVVGIWYVYFQKPVIRTAQETKGTTIGTDYVVKVADFMKGTNFDVWKNIEILIRQRLDGIDRMTSIYRADSEVSRFNNSGSTDWFNVSKDTAEVVQTALEISQLTEGAFDITVAPLVELWGFGVNRQHHLTTNDLEEKTNQIKQKICYDKLEVRSHPPALKKSIPELQIDLSAIARGYAVDCVAELLEENGFMNYMVEVGGEVRCRGNKGTAGDWMIGIEKPLIVSTNEFSGLQRKLRIGDRALATSGDYQNYREIDGVRFSHFIDPRTGFPTEHLAINEVKTLQSELLQKESLQPELLQTEQLQTEQLQMEPLQTESLQQELLPQKSLPAESSQTKPLQNERLLTKQLPSDIKERLGSVSVLAKTCVRADALATAFFVLGEHKGLELAEKHGIAVLFLFRTEQKDRPIREAVSTTFPKSE